MSKKSKGRAPRLKRDEYRDLTALELAFNDDRELTRAELFELRMILADIGADRNPCDRYWKTAGGRLGGKDAQAKEYAALDMALDQAEQGEDFSVKSSRGKAAKRWGLSDPVVGHAWEDPDLDVKALVAAGNRTDLRTLQTWRLAYMKSKKRKRKK